MSSLLVLDSTTWLQPAVRQPRSPCLRIPQVMLFLTLSWYRVARLRRRRCRPRCSRWCLTACWVLAVLDAAATCVSTRYAFLLLVALWSKYTVFTPKSVEGSIQKRDRSTGSGSAFARQPERAPRGARPACQVELLQGGDELSTIGSPQNLLLGPHSRFKKSKISLIFLAIPIDTWVLGG